MRRGFCQFASRADLSNPPVSSALARFLRDHRRIDLPYGPVVAHQPVALRLGVVELAEELTGHAAEIFLLSEFRVHAGDCAGELGFGFFGEDRHAIALEATAQGVDFAAGERIKAVVGPDFAGPIVARRGQAKPAVLADDADLRGFGGETPPWLSWMSPPPCQGKPLGLVHQPGRIELP